MNTLALSLPSHEATVDARQLHETLGMTGDFSKWIKETVDRLAFVEGKDFVVLLPRDENSEGRPATNYALTSIAAQVVAISARTPKSQEVRDQLIAQWNSPAATMARALVFAESELRRQGEETAKALSRVAELEPKAQTFDRLMGVDDVVPMVQAANLLTQSCRKLGRNRLFRVLRNLRVLKHDNTPYQEHIEANRFRVVEKLWTDPHGKDHVKPQTYVTQRGLAYLQRLLGAEPAVN